MRQLFTTKQSIYTSLAAWRFNAVRTSSQMKTADGMLISRLFMALFWGPLIAVVTLWPPSGDGWS